jgi:2-polyprenyl-3-methyl-5-hydroxy-6-metoxy-1,4-benzoquinol methylase
MIKLIEGRPMPDHLNTIYPGNYFDKYGSRNLIVRWMMKNFARSLFELIYKVNPESIHDVGCGEGHWTLELARMGYTVKGSDLSSRAFQEIPKGLTVQFQERDVYQLVPIEDSADLIICCEVLEHLEKPAKALLKLQEVTSGHLILSVPREPLWRFLNLLRGSYWRRLGNTPGHLQHWSTKEFIRTVSDYFEVIEVRKPLPWTMILCRPRKEVL